jgi:hypothetical protein
MQHHLVNLLFRDGVYERSKTIETFSHAEIGDLDGAWNTLAHLGNSDRIYVVQSAALAQSKIGDTQGALAWAARQISPRDKALALVGSAEGILQRLEPAKK